MRSHLPVATLRRALFDYTRKLTSETGSVAILSPRKGAAVGGSGIVEGTAQLPADASLWVLVHRQDVNGWWPQSDGAVPVENGHWRTTVRYGELQDEGHEFEIAAVIVQPATATLWSNWLSDAASGRNVPPLRLPPNRYLRAADFTVVRKQSGVG